jgi:hypothetical protein
MLRETQVKTFSALLLFLASAIAVPATSFADNILVFGDRSGDRANLTSTLELLGHTVTNQADLPGDVSGFDTIWHVGAFVALSGGVQAQLSAYMAGGGGVHLTGERPCCEVLNDSVEAYVNSVVAAGGVQVGDLGDIGGPYDINPAAAGDLASNPNVVSTWAPSAPGGMGGLGGLPDPNILVSGAGDVPVGGAWMEGDMTSGQGRMTLLMDVNWFSNVSGDNIPFVENIQVFLNGGEAAPNARFRVTKTFSDGLDAEVEVMLTCNTGLPLEQTFTIAGGDPEGVTFVVTDIPEGGADCEVTETGSPDGYTVALNDGAGCEWENVTSGFRFCNITNTADPATYTVLKDFTVQRVGGDVVLAEADITIECDSEILNGGIEDDGTWTLSDTLTDGETLVASVDTTEGSATCSATEEITQSGVEQSASGCGEVSLPAGGSHLCTFTNTVFFEGIPTLSQYGLAILVLLTLGVGFVGLRRFV